MIWLAVVIGIAALIYLIGSRTKYYKAVTFEDFPRFLASLMVQFSDGGLLFFNHEGSERFLQFTKYIHDGKESLHFGFPDAPWSRDFFESIKKKFLDEKIHFSVVATHSEPTKAFIDVADIPSIEQATTISRLAMSAMNLSMRDTFTAYFRGRVSTNIYKNNAPLYDKYLGRNLTSRSS